MSRVDKNDPTVTEFQIGGKGFDSDMNMLRPSDSSYESAFCRLGGCIAENTHLIQLDIYLSDGILLHTTDRGFYDGLLRNSSIKTLRLLCPPNTNIIGGVEQEILTAYHANNHLTQLTLISIDMQNGRDLFTTTLRCSPNLKQLELLECNITDELLLQLIESVRECALEKLGLMTNRIGNTGCDILAALLEDPKCNIHTLDLNNNQIIKWYEKVDTAVAEIVNQMSTDPGRRWRQPVIQAHVFRFGLNVRLSAMYQFARSMPLLFEPISRMEVEEND